MQVFYVDFGTVGEIFKRDVRFLGKQFAKHPAFAMRGCLDHIRPNDGIWTLEAMVAFNEHVQKFSEVGVLAKVTNVNSPVSGTVFFFGVQIYSVIKIAPKKIECLSRRKHCIWK